MNIGDFFKGDHGGEKFGNYGEYMQALFVCVDVGLEDYLGGLEEIFMDEEGKAKNILYPDIEIAHKQCLERISSFYDNMEMEKEEINSEESEESEELDEIDHLFEELLQTAEIEEPLLSGITIEEMLENIAVRAAYSAETGMDFPFYKLCKRLDLNNFDVFCLTCAIVSSTQTNYASVFQLINQNGNLSVPTIESAARVYFGAKFTMVNAFGRMSRALERLEPVISLKISEMAPFQTAISPDKRLIDFLFGMEPEAIDSHYKRFLSRVTNDDELEPLIANQEQPEQLEISYQDQVRIFALWGDEGSGRTFTIRHFCKDKEMGCIDINGGKLFSYDFAFVENTIWAAGREALLTGSACSISNVSYREEEKEKFYGYMDLTFGKLSAREIPVFIISKEKLPIREMTNMLFTQLELPTPTNNERIQVWQYYAEAYSLETEVDLVEMATKFLFTPGKIKNSLEQAKRLANMKKLMSIPRNILFESCYSQMSHELTQKATKIKATYTWDDIVMSKEQRQSLEYACDQMRYRKQVFEDWDYNRKYPYGRGLSVLLFGAPGTGKSMCAQVLANALNLELYRVDLSKVVDKYVGETEKSISMIFREAKKCNVVLFFDECDTLFAKRSDDGGSNQASANNKTALLLQEVEAYDGVSVLATNYKHNIDPAFFRRMKFIVEFQFPDPQTRKILWETTIPKGTPLAEDVDVDFLANRFEFVGGNIKNCILNAAFLAAGDPTSAGKVHMRHYLLAIKYEFVKTGKVFTRVDFEPFAEEVFG